MWVISRIYALVLLTLIVWGFQIIFLLTPVVWGVQIKVFVYLTDPGCVGFSEGTLCCLTGPNYMWGFQRVFVRVLLAPGDCGVFRLLLTV